MGIHVIILIIASQTLVCQSASDHVYSFMYGSCFNKVNKAERRYLLVIIACSKDIYNNREWFSNYSLSFALIGHFVIDLLIAGQRSNLPMFVGLPVFIHKRALF